MPFEAQLEICHLYTYIHRQPKPKLCWEALLSKHNGGTGDSRAQASPFFFSQFTNLRRAGLSEEQCFCVIVMFHFHHERKYTNTNYVCPRMLFWGTSESEYVGIVRVVYNTCGKVKLDIKNKFWLKIAEGHFFGSPCRFCHICQDCLTKYHPFILLSHLGSYNRLPPASGVGPCQS